MKLRNIAIIAHVDHGKTTLVDNLLKQSGTFRENQQVEERVMDSNDLEKERGITILAKPTSIMWNDYKINIIDTPGHADFGGEVERILSMVDGVILLVDSAEGPLPQTKFVLSKALAQGIRPILVINKIDRSDARPDEVLDEAFDLFVSLDANDEQLDFPTMYASGRDGWCVKELEGEPRESLKPMLDLIVNHVPEPDVNEDAPFSMLSTLLGADSFLGRTLTGKVYSGKAKVNSPVKSMDLNGEIVEQGRLTKLFGFKGVERVQIEEAIAGDIICVAGLQKTSVSDTIADVSVEDPIYSTPIDPPTISITITVNDAPFAGQEGTKVTSTMIRERLLAEAETNVAIEVTEGQGKDALEVAGRGELQLGVLIENMRREGFELSVSRPRVVYKEENGQRLEPIEEVVIDVDDEHSGTVIEKMAKRKAEMKEMKTNDSGRTRIIFHAPSRGLIGYQGEFLTDTRGSGLMNRLFLDYQPHKGDVSTRHTGALISTDTGEAVAYAIFNLQDRGTMFVNPQEKIYQGMIVGENSRDNDLEINIQKGKKHSNVRASGTDEAVILTPPKKMTLEEMMSYINDDELVEVTPENLRLRKRHLCPHERKKESRAEKSA